MDAIVNRAHAPIADLFRLYEQMPQRANPKRQSFRMPDEMMAAHVIDPTIFGGFDDMYIDIVTHNDGHYGDTSFWDANWRGIGGTAGLPARTILRSRPGAFRC